ncbi:MAG: 3-oxoacyl-[acyl-carrier-protein] reductase [Deltaproteobacteria bacterium]|nr:3-oxoacyl-[acyl-carrier-protein] reductase [Deltaproteobacteria bacterium]
MILNGQVALVTGGSRGIGRAIALALAQAGAYVVINYRGNRPAAELTLEELSDKGGRGELSQFDVSVEKEVDGAVKQIVDGQGKVDILVNNAGVTSDGLLIRMKSEDWDQVIGTNLKGTVLCTKTVCRVMIRQRYGRIINLSSVVGQMGNVGQSLYAASKAGILGFTKSIARELASRAVTVNAVTPGFIETEMTAKLTPQLQEEFLRSIPLGRFGNCEEVAQLVVFLTGPGAGYITGQVIGVNGGLYM